VNEVVEVNDAGRFLLGLLLKGNGRQIGRSPHALVLFGLLGLGPSPATAHYPSPPVAPLLGINR